MKNKGFTILEILVVLTVLAILIGIAVPRMKGMQDQANVQKTKSEMKTLQTAVEAYYINHSNVYPNTSTALYMGILTNETVKIVDRALYDPFLGTATEYNYVKNGNYYVLSSVGLGGSGAAGTISSATGAVTTAGTGPVICITNGTGC